jgi:hypothetical protein
MYLFGGDQYYPCGGARDFIGIVLSYEQGLEMVAKRQCDWWHFTDVHMKVLKSGNSGLYS